MDTIRATIKKIAAALLVVLVISPVANAHEDAAEHQSHQLADAKLAQEARERDNRPFLMRMHALLSAVMCDAQAAELVGNQGTLGEWGPVIAWPFAFATAANLPDGRILTVGANNVSSFSGGTNTYATVWNPATGQFLSRNHNAHSMFCGIPVMLEDGRVFLNGGDGTRERVSTFDYRTNTWQRVQDMNVGRWYPGTVAMPNGQVFTAIGNPGSQYPEIWSASQGWAYLNGANLQGPILDFTVFENNWLPYFHVAPDGRIFHSGPTQQMNWISPVGSGSVSSASLTNTWYPDNSVGVMYDEGKILVAGGSVATGGNPDSTPTNKAIIIDLTGSTPQKTAIAPMLYARKFNYGVILPTGEVMVVGGNTSGIEFSDQGSVLTPEIWNPTTQSWRPVADMAVPRNYHSVALLMADGRVWSGGGGLCNCSADHPDAQVYSPPYLFNLDGTLASRPVITSAPGSASYGRTISVQATAGLSKFSLIKISATTHNLNSDLRFLNVPFTEVSTGQYQLTLHSNRNVLTPGYWMLFGIDGQDVPSVAKVINISTANAPIVTNPGSQSTVRDGNVNLAINASDPNGDVLSFSATGLPQGLSIDAVTGVISGTANTTGNFLVTVNVSDGTNTAGVSFGWAVYAPGTPLNRAPVIASLTNQNSVAGNAVTLQISASDPDGDPITFSATGLPPGLSINGPTGVISGTPTSAGGFNVVVTAQDNHGAAGNASFVWTVTAPSFSIDPISSPPKLVNTAISYTASVRNAVNPRYKWLFGDNTPETAYSASPNATHTFTNPGLYVVRVTVTDNSGIEQSQTFVQAIHLPQTANRPSVSSNITFAQPPTGNGRIWVVNQDNDSVSVFDAVTNAKLAEIAVGKAPRAVAVAPDGTLWVTNKGAATISVINPAAFTVTQTVPLPRASQPFGVVFSPTGSDAYVTLEASGKLIKIDPSTGAQTGSISVGANPRHLSISGDGSTVLVARYVTPPLPGEDTASVQTAANNINYGGEVIVVNPATMSVVETVVLQHSNKTDTENQGSGIPNYLGAPVISPDGLTAWVPSKQDNIKRGTLRNGNNLDFQNTVRAISSRIDLTTNGEDYAARIDHDNAGVASAGLFDPYGSYLFVALETNREVAIVDAHSKREIVRIAVGRAPQGFAMSGDGSRLFVNNFMDRSITVLDLSGLMNTGAHVIPTLATLPAVGSEKLNAQVLNGKQLFYDAKDTRLARDSYISCAACHNDGGHDGRVWDLTGFGEGLRNTIKLGGRAGMGHGFLHWSGNFDEVQDFEGQIRGLAGGTGLMTDAAFTATQDPLGATKAGRSGDLDALAAYVASLNSFSGSPYRNADGTLTAVGIAGKSIFESANCVQCHNGANFTVSGANTLHSIGTIKPSSGKRLNATLTGIDTPTLRDVWATAPYLHDGSAATLADAVRAHSSVTLTDGAVGQLAAYLQQIDSSEPAPFNPSADTTPPTDPTNLTATAVSTGQIDLSWTASTDNVGVTGYQVERCQGAGCSNFAQIGTPTGTSFSNTGLTAGTTYGYRVRATDAVPNFSGYSNIATATSFAVQPPVLCNGLPATIVGTDGNDYLVGTPGNDVIHGVAGNDTTFGLGGNDVICGGPGRDKLYGNRGNDKLFGGAGNDVLKGGTGRDRLSGQSGNDIMDGGSGSDRCDGRSGTDKATRCERRTRVP